MTYDVYNLKSEEEMRLMGNPLMRVLLVAGILLASPYIIAKIMHG